jgi:hypothetical protein
VIRELPSVTWRSRAEFRSNRPAKVKAVPSQIQVPKLGLRGYNQVVCAPHQVVMADNLILPDSYRHYIRKLGNHYLSDLTRNFTQYKRPLENPEPLPGEYHFLASEYPQHFGHLMTEQVSRLWAWQEAKRAYPGLKALVSLRADGEKLHGLEASVFVAEGVPPEDIVGVEGAVRVETLLAPTPMFVNPRYVHPDIVTVWRTIGKNLVSQAPDGRSPERSSFRGGLTWSGNAEMGPKSKSSSGATASRCCI